MPRSTVYAHTSRLRRCITDLLLSSQVFSTFDVIEIQKRKKKKKKGKKGGAPDNLERSMLVKRAPGNSTCASKPLLRMVFNRL